MKFKTVEEAFNYYNSQTIKAIEKRAQEIQETVNNDAEADIAGLSIEAEGLQQAKENLVEKRSSILSFNPITGTKKKTENVENTVDVFGTPEYRSAFYKGLLGKEMTQPEQRAMETANEVLRVEKRLDAFNTVTNNASVIPTQTLNEVVRKARTQGGLLTEARGFNIPSNLKVPVGTPLTKAEWHVEGEKVESEKTTTAFVEFKPHELIKIFSISASAKKMSIQAFEAYVTDELVASVMEAIEEALVSGTGVGQGKGIETVTFTVGTNAIEYAKDAVPAYTDFTKTIALLKRGYSKGAKWAMNNATLYNKVYSVVDGNKRPIFIADPKGESIGKILGFDVVIDDNIADGDMFLGNYKQYLGYNIPEGIALEVSTQSSFNKGLVDYRALAIADTQVILPEAFVKLSEAEA